MWLLSFNAFDFSKKFAFGFGVGVGIGVVVRKIIQEHRKQREQLISCLKQLAVEVRQLRGSLIESVKAETKENEPANCELSSNEDDDEFFDPEMGAEESNDIQKFLEEIDKLQGGTLTEQQHACDLLTDKRQLIANNCEILWRLAKAYFQIATQKEKQGDVEQQRKLVTKGVDIAEEAVVCGNSNFYAHQWYAMLLGKSTSFLETKEKILTGYKYKHHIEMSIELDSSNALSHYLLGRYFFEVYMLPWYMRKAAAALFAEPPTATAQDALKCFTKAEELKPGFWAENPLYIGKCYYEMSDYSNAKKWFRKTLDVVDNSEEATKVKEEASNLLNKC